MPASAYRQADSVGEERWRPGRVGWHGDGHLEFELWGTALAEAQRRGGDVLGPSDLHTSGSATC